MNKTLVPVLVTALALTGLTGCSNRNDEIEAQLQQHDAQLRRMQPVQADNSNEVQALREEVRELRGQIADLKKIGGAGVLLDKINRHEAALHQVEVSMAMKFDLGDPLPETGTMAAPVAPAADGAAVPAAATSDTVLPDFSYGGLAGAGTAAAVTPAPAPSASTWGQETPKPRQTQAEKDIKTALYQAGVNAFNSRKYTEAQRSFSDYLQNFGDADARTSASAQYYIGECYFQTNQFADAALAYDTVITRYPKSDRVPSAYLKQGICFSKMKQKDGARSRMNELIKKYPNSPEAKRARDFLKTNK